VNELTGLLEQDQMNMLATTAVFLCFVSAVLSANRDHPEYDHQTKTYVATHKPSYCSSPCSVTPFFSPDHSIDTYVKLIEEAEESIDLFAPGMYSECVLYILCESDVYIYSNTSSYLFSRF